MSSTPIHLMDVVEENNDNNDIHQTGDTDTDEQGDTHNFTNKRARLENHQEEEQIFTSAQEKRLEEMLTRQSNTLIDFLASKFGDQLHSNHQQPVTGLSTESQNPPSWNRTLHESIIDDLSSRNHKATLHDDNSAIPLDPLTRVFTENPFLAEGLMLISNKSVWQLHDFSEISKRFNLTNITSQEQEFRNTTTTLTIPEMLNSCALSVESSRIGSNSTRPIDHGTVIRASFNRNRESQIFQFVDIVDRRTIHTEEIPLRTSSYTLMPATVDSQTSRKTSRLSEAALAQGEISATRLADKTGSDLLYDMLHVLSKKERELGLVQTQARVCVAVSQETAHDLLQWRVRDISDWSPSTLEEALKAHAIKKAFAPKPALKDANDCLLAWRNVVIALTRGLELKVDAPVTIHLWGLQNQMTTFLGAMSASNPQLRTNGFCSLFLNSALQSVCRVMGDYHTTNEDIGCSLDEVEVTPHSIHYTLAIQDLNLEMQERVLRMETQCNFAATSTTGQQSGGRGTGRKNDKSGQAGGRTSSDSTSKPTMCIKYFTTAGCTRPKCWFTHPTGKLTTTEKASILESIKNANGRFPDKTPLVVDESKL